MLALAPGCFMTRGTVNAPIERATVEKLTPGTSHARRCASRAEPTAYAYGAMVLPAVAQPLRNMG